MYVQSKSQKREANRIMAIGYKSVSIGTVISILVKIILGLSLKTCLIEIICLAVTVVYCFGRTQERGTKFVMDGTEEQREFLDSIFAKGCIMQCILIIGLPLLLACLEESLDNIIYYGVPLMIYVVIMSILFGYSIITKKKFYTFDSKKGFIIETVIMGLLFALGFEFIRFDSDEIFDLLDFFMFWFSAIGFGGFMGFTVGSLSVFDKEAVKKIMEEEKASRGIVDDTTEK